MIGSQEGGRCIRYSRAILAAGPGLAVRVLGDVTEGDALEVLRQVDEIYINTIREFGLYDKIWQAFAVFLPVRCRLSPDIFSQTCTCNGDLIACYAQQMAL